MENVRFKETGRQVTVSLTMFVLFDAVGLKSITDGYFNSIFLVKRMKHAARCTADVVPNKERED